jgi:hypothetical protein
MRPQVPSWKSANPVVFRGMVMDFRKKPLRSWEEILMARRFRLLKNSDNVNLAIYHKDTTWKPEASSI